MSNRPLSASDAFASLDGLGTTVHSLIELMRAFDSVLRSLDETAIANALPWRELWEEEAQTPDSRTTIAPTGKRQLQAYSIAFRLLAHAEENAVAQQERQQQQRAPEAGPSGSWQRVLDSAVQTGLSQADILALLERVRVEPVLTAHPTEAKRQTVLEQHRRVYKLLVKLENSMWTDSERHLIRQELKGCLELLWRTGEVYLEKPGIEDERRLALHFLHRVFPDTLSMAAERLYSACRRLGFAESMAEQAMYTPRFTFGNWVGGDRDGHPGVSADTTRETLMLLRETAIELLDSALQSLGQHMSLTDQGTPAAAAMTEAFELQRQSLGLTAQQALDRNNGEPWRQWVNLMRVRLALSPEDGGYRAADELQDDLQRLDSSLEATGAHRLAMIELRPVQQLVRSFGLHLAQLDVRQNSEFHDRAIALLLDAAGIADGAAYSDWTREQRRVFLDAELQSSRPLSRSATHEARAVLSVYQVLAEHLTRFGSEGLGALIVSMTRDSTDLLAVYLLARETALLQEGAEGLFLPVEVVPLFETIEDLEKAPGILEDYLAHPIVRRSLEYRRTSNGSENPVQQIMVGYSDSGKDGGIVASFWHLYQAQQSLTEVAKRHGVRLRFFHGRGGAIGRGAGPTNRFLKALPDASAGGDIRLTEQGETISQKYANRITAAHHLELLGAGAFGTLLPSNSDAQPENLQAAMAEVSAVSYRRYRQLVEHDGFIEFFAFATPVDAIEASRIGSRPARRTGQRTLADLRAIPWGFAWNQSRFVLPGWFGLGSGMAGLAAKDPVAFQAVLDAKVEGTRRWAPLHYMVSNIATAFMMVNRHEMERYTALVPESDNRDAILHLINDEYELTEQMLEKFYDGTLAERRPRIHQVLSLRDQALTPLHAKQRELLRVWRQQSDDEAITDNAHEALTRELLLSINAIAAGLGVTG